LEPFELKQLIDSKEVIFSIICLGRIHDPRFIYYQVEKDGETVCIIKADDECVVEVESGQVPVENLANICIEIKKQYS
jgi:hypothetical protein